MEEKTPIPPLIKLLILMQNEEEGDISQDFLDLLRTVTKDGTKEVNVKNFVVVVTFSGIYREDWTSYSSATCC